MIQPTKESSVDQNDTIRMTLCLADEVTLISWIVQPLTLASAWCG